MWRDRRQPEFCHDKEAEVPPDEPLPVQVKEAPLKVAVLYALVGGLWVLFSDLVLAALVADSITITRLQTLKGWFYVFATALVLYLQVRHHATAVQRWGQALRRSLVLERAVRSIDAALIQEKNIDAVLAAVCDAVVKLGHRMCWVGLAEPDHTVRPVAARGFAAGYLEAIRVRWAAASPWTTSALASPPSTT